MDYAIEWTESAQADFEAAIRQLAIDSPQAAEALRVAALESVDVLARLPFIGPPYERDRRNQTREILCKPYRIFYRVDEAASRVYILRVWHSARREPRLPMA